jgi:hypothetical protein
MSGPDLFTMAAVTHAAHAFTNPTCTRGKPVTFNVFDGEDVRIITPRGRDAWALGELIAAGANGCTPIDQPGPRWSGYIFKLKRIYRLSIETITEMHGGEYAGKHARYVLRSKVHFADPADASRHRGDQ